MIPYGKHYLDEEDIEAVVEVLRNGWLTQGPKVKELEIDVANYVGSKYAVAVSSGTAALHLACIAVEVGDSSKVVTSANTFVASANCIRYVGAMPVFCDIDPETLNLDINQFNNIVQNESNIEAIIPVHFGGLPCDMESIHNISNKHRIKVIEDASHAFGAVYKNGKRVGNCQYSDMTVFSLHPVKGITAGEGGIITTNCEKTYLQLLNLRSHGICKGNFDFPGVSELGDELVYKEEAIEDGKLNPWYYEMQSLGFNYRITDIQCALVSSQLKKADIFLNRRKEIVELYDEQLSKFENILCTQKSSRQESSNHIYVVRIDYDALGKTRAQVMRELLDKGIGTQVHYIPVARHPYYNELGFKANDYPNAEKYYSEALTIPVYYELSNSQVCEVIDGLKEVLFN